MTMTARATVLPTWKRVEYEPIAAPRRLRSVLLLGGGKGLNDFAAATGRSVLDLPLTDNQTLLSSWRQQLEGAVERRGPDDQAMQVRVVGGVPIRAVGDDWDFAVHFEHTPDPRELRGTGGILRDFAADCPDDDYMLVASAATLILEPLNELLGELFSARSDVAFFVHEDDSASNLMLIRCGCLRSIAEAGFVDFKEQALLKIASAGSVTAIRRRHRVATSLRTPAEYIRSVRAHHESHSAEMPTDLEIGCRDAFSEDWQSAFTIVERGAEVDRSACLHDSVVLAGGRVEGNAIVVRSVVCPQALVPSNAVILDQLVLPNRNGRRPAH
jgi:hypothetical protein